MSKYQIVGVRAETEEEKAQKAWLFQQRLASPDNLEGAAKQVIGLVTGLFTILFGVMALNTEPTKVPIFMAQPAFRFMAALSVFLFIVALCAAVVVTFPCRRLYRTNMPTNQLSTFNEMLESKSMALTVSYSAFGFGILVFGGVLIAAILSVAPKP